MPQEKKSRQTELDKLHMILDNPRNPQLEDIGQHLDPTLESIRQRLIGKTYSGQARTQHVKTRGSSYLQPRAVIRSLQQPDQYDTTSASSLVSQVSQESPRASQSFIHQLIIQPQDLYEVEKVDVVTDEFVEVKPKGKPEKKDTAPVSSLNVGDALQRDVVDERIRPILQWEPVQTLPAQQEKPLPEKSDVIDFELVQETAASLNQDGEVSSPEVQPSKSDIEQSDHQRKNRKERRRLKREEKEARKRAKQQEKLVRKQEKQQALERKKHTKEQQALQQQKLKELPETQLTLEQTPSVKNFVQDIFKEISCIDEHTAELLYRHGFFSIDNIKDASIQDLVAIPGIDKKTAKTIKDEVDMLTSGKKEPDLQQPNKKTVQKINVKKPFADEFTEWESHEIPTSKTIETAEEPYVYDQYTLYKKEIEAADGKKTTIHFFSKDQPDQGIPTSLPKGYSVELNKKTGLPYLKKQKEE
ncbi:MAG: helix-hairpin-helix domain-containing protein [Candidatus Thermoplasmatota archaeon]